MANSVPMDSIINSPRGLTGIMMRGPEIIKEHEDGYLHRDSLDPNRSSDEVSSVSLSLSLQNRRDRELSRKVRRLYGLHPEGQIQYI